VAGLQVEEAEDERAGKAEHRAREVLAIDESVAVVVYPVVPAAGTVLAGVDPDVGGEIRMRVVHARVDDPDRNVWAPGGDRPCLGSVDVGVRSPGDPVHGLARVVEPPELRERGIVRELVDVEMHVWLGVAHARVALEGGDDAVAAVRRHGREQDADRAKPLLDSGAQPCNEFPLCGR